MLQSAYRLSKKPAVFTAYCWDLVLMDRILTNEVAAGHGFDGRTGWVYKLSDLLRSDLHFELLTPRLFNPQ